MGRGRWVHRRGREPYEELVLPRYVTAFREHVAVFV
jgi:hypothetical protein